MLRHTFNYFKYFGIAFDINTGEHDFIGCEICQKEAVDQHHIERRQKGNAELDKVENIIALCRDCHNAAHANRILKVDLQTIHNLKMAEHKYFYS